MRGENVQYNSQKTNTTDSFYAPEEATSQNINYSVCSAYSYYIYNDLLNVKIPHYTANLIDYAETNAGKLGVVAYGKRKSEKNLNLIVYDESEGKSVTLKNPNLSEILPYLKVGDVVDAYIIESGGGDNGKMVNSKIDNHHYLFYSSRLSNNYPVLSNGEHIKEGSFHLSKLSISSHWENLNATTPKYTKDEYSIVRFATEKNNKAILVYYGNKEHNTEIHLLSKTSDRVKYFRLYIEKTVS